MVVDSREQNWSALKPRGPRAMARSAAISALGSLAQFTGRVDAALVKPRVQVLLLHHIFEDEEIRFRLMVQWLTRQHTFITYSEAVHRIESGAIDKPYITFTFDDGFKNCLRASKILQEFDASACFFVCPAIVGETDRERITNFSRQRLGLPITLEFMSWDDLASLRDAGHDIGGHTMTHANLARISSSQAREEIEQSFQSIKQRLGDVKHFAWTFGRFEDFTPDAARTVYETGYTSCASGVRGAHAPHDNRIERPCIRRDHTIAAAPLNHIKYFLSQSSRRMSLAMQHWPGGWVV